MTLPTANAAAATLLPQQPIPLQQVPPPVRLDVQFNVPQTFRIRFTRKLLTDDLHELVDLLMADPQAPAPQLLAVVDQSVVDARPDLPEGLHRLAQTLQRELPIPMVVLPAGEQAKQQLDHVLPLLEQIHRFALDRHSYLIAFGGGAVLDAAGLAANLAHRGVRLIRVPTTTLAQADSAVGVKNAVNFHNQKNWLGSFAVPHASIHDADLLRTLPDRDFLAGFAEAVKVALLKDPELLQQIRRSVDAIRNRDHEVCTHILQRSALLHLDHITRGNDPFESTQARPLDFGHWLAHRLETLSGYTLRHGEAVAIGLACDLQLSTRLTGLPGDVARDAIDLLRELQLPTACAPGLHSLRDLVVGVEQFRQHLGGRLCITLLRDIGQPVQCHALPESDLSHVLRTIHQSTS